MNWIPCERLTAQFCIVRIENPILRISEMPKSLSTFIGLALVGLIAALSLEHSSLTIPLRQSAINSALGDQSTIHMVSPIHTSLLFTLFLEIQFTNSLVSREYCYLVVIKITTPLNKYFLDILNCNFFTRFKIIL